MRRYFIWLVSGLVALAAYAIGNAAGLSNIVVLIVAFIGAIAGSIIATNYLKQRQSNRD